MTEQQSTTNPEENQIVTKDHFSTIREQLRVLQEENEKQVFDYESTKGEKEVRSYIYAMRQSKSAIASVHKSAKAEALAVGKKLDADKRELTAEVELMIEVHDKPLRDKKERIEREEAESKYCSDFYEATLENTRIDEERRMIALEKYELDHAEAIHMHDLFKREQVVKAAEEKAMAEQAERERIANEDRIKKEAAEKKIADDLAEIERNRQANTENQRTKNNESMVCFIGIGLSPEDAQKTVEAIAKKQIKHVFIQY